MSQTKTETPAKKTLTVEDLKLVRGGDGISIRSPGGEAESGAMRTPLPPVEF